jgi:hypothetical protein
MMFAPAPLQKKPDVLKNKKRRAERLSASEEIIIPCVIFFNLFVCVRVCVCL